MKFSKNQKEIIDKLLLESDEEQIKNGNTTYTQEEMVKFFSIPKEERELHYNKLC